MPSFCASQAFSIACSLNNTAVAMMMQGRFESAASTSKDAMSILQLMLNPVSDEQLVTFAQEKLQNASSLMCQRCDIGQYSESPVPLKAIESNDFQSLSQAISSVNDSTSSFVALLIREPHDVSSTTLSDTSIQKESGIVIFNYGVALLLLAAYAEPQGEAQDNRNMLSAAHKTLLMACKAFSKVLSNVEVETSDEIETACFIVLALRCVSQVLVELNCSAQAKQAQQAIQGIVSTTLHKTHMDCLTFNQGAAAAAA